MLTGCTVASLARFAVCTGDCFCCCLPLLLLLLLMHLRFCAKSLIQRCASAQAVFAHDDSNAALWACYRPGDVTSTYMPTVYTASNRLPINTKSWFSMIGACLSLAFQPGPAFAACLPCFSRVFLLFSCSTCLAVLYSGRSLGR